MTIMTADPSAPSINLGIQDPGFTMFYAGLTLNAKELKALFRFEKMRRAAVMKEMRRMANIVANRAGKKDPVFKKPAVQKGPRKVNPRDIPSIDVPEWG